MGRGTMSGVKGPSFDPGRVQETEKKEVGEFVPELGQQKHSVQQAEAGRARIITGSQLLQDLSIILSEQNIESVRKYSEYKREKEMQPLLQWAGVILENIERAQLTAGEKATLKDIVQDMQDAFDMEGVESQIYCLKEAQSKVTKLLPPDVKSTQNPVNVIFRKLTELTDAAKKANSGYNQQRAAAKKDRHKTSPLSHPLSQYGAQGKELRDLKQMVADKNLTDFERGALSKLLDDLGRIFAHPSDKQLDVFEKKLEQEEVRIVTGKALKINIFDQLKRMIGSLFSGKLRSKI
jgi:hypothetical protein